jgi:hypothetical protein
MAFRVEHRSKQPVLDHKDKGGRRVTEILQFLLYFVSCADGTGNDR